MSIGHSRKELGKMHREFYESRMAKSKDGEAFQRALLSMIKATLDVIDANNQKLEESLKAILKDDVKAHLKDDVKTILKDDMKSILKDDVKSLVKKYSRESQ